MASGVVRHLCLPVLLVVAGCSGNSGGGGNRDGASGGTGSSGAQATAHAPELSSAAAQVAGRHGYDLVIQVSGLDPDGDVHGLWVRFVDAGGATIAAQDFNQDGQPDTQGLLLLSGLQGQTSFAAVMPLEGLVARVPTLGSLVVHLEDAAGNHSADMTLALQEQPVRALGQGCDPTYLLDRCAPTLGCRSSPATCQEGLAPQVTKAAYLRAPAGPKLLLEGTEPDDDLSTLSLEFLDAAGDPVLVDTDGDDTPDTATFVVDARSAMQDGAFFYFMQSAQGFDATVLQIAVTPVDEGNHRGARTVARIASTPVRQAGQSCDPRGFNTCTSASVCATAPGGAGHTCQTPRQARQQKCLSAPTLDPAAGITVVSGVVSGASLWDAPLGCVSGDPLGRPEAAVLLRVATATSLTLTTAMPGTNFDTTVYVLADCSEQAEAPLACNDDIPGSPSSTLNLVDLAAGEYLVVVDSFAPAGGAFQLAITTP